MSLRLTALMLAGVFLISAHASCIPKPNPKSSSIAEGDALAQILKDAAVCPHDVLALRALFVAHGLNIESTMVANEGFHNVTSGSYSFFELVSGTYKNSTIKPGDVYWGHFTQVDEDHVLQLDQSPENKKLMIEAIAWDDKKGGFNFYELKGDGQTGQWYFRGDSWDIYLDNQYLHLQADRTKPQFGSRLRCSGCHGGGGPIMKELAKPNNDWWQLDRPLLLNTFILDETLKNILNNTHSAKVLSAAVNQGTQRLFANPQFIQKRTSMTLQEQLRPLFCPVELNFNSDTHPIDEANAPIHLPVDFFIDPRFIPADFPRFIEVSRADYESLLEEFDSSFSGTQLKDADHAWLTPVKANADIQWINQLVAESVIDEQFVVDVLAVDMTNPVFSESRCALLKYIPNKGTHWRETFKEQLQRAPEPQAKRLLKNMNNPSHSVVYYKKLASQYLEQCRLKLKNSDHLKLIYQLLVQRRAEINVSEISANPLGQILEPGFRVIFPVTKFKPKAGALKLDLNCDVHENQ
jgi:hypothetical protein